MMIHKTLAAVTVFALCANGALADEDYFVPLPGTTLIFGDGIPDPLTVSGKEFSNKSDITTVPTPHAAEPGAYQLWAGDGRVRDAKDVSTLFTFTNNAQIDALANQHDALFGNAVNNTAALALSFEGDGRVHYERTNGDNNVWATVPQISHSHAGNPAFDLDALELWGPEAPQAGPGGSDSTRLSLEGDPLGVGIFNDNGSAFAFTSDYAGAIATLLGDPDLTSLLLNELDVDALMVNEFGSVDGDFDVGDRLLVSFQPITVIAVPGGPSGVVLDGGEIFLLDFTAVAGVTASYLFHGGHLWDTAFDVMGTFGVLSENVDALEAIASVPAPSALMGGLVLLVAAMRRRLV
jgi:hypothetical protein